MPDLQITSERTPRFDLPFLFPGQTQKEAFVNETLVRLDALVHSSVVSESATPPAEPVDGDTFIVASGPEEAWTGRDGQLAIWARNQWVFQVPHDGVSVLDRSANSIAYYREGAGWERATSPETVSGGSFQDAEARAAIAALAAVLRVARIIS